MNIPKFEDLNCSNCTERSMKIHYPEFWKFITDNYPKDLIWTEKLYWYYNNINEHPVCPVCGKFTKFINITLGYREFCSNKCVAKSSDVSDRKKETTMKRYGVVNPMFSHEMKNKIKKTNLEKYGVENPFASEKIKQKIRQTNLEKYGVEYPQQSKEIYEKSKQTNLKKYGFEYNSQNEDIKKKKEQSSLEKYGTKTPLQSDVIKSQIKETLIKHYGVDNYNKTQEYKDMMKEKMPEIRKKMVNTCLERYGVEYYSQTPEYLERSYQTKKENGTFNHSQIEEDFAEWLTKHDIKYIRQYKSDLYPFRCDFYFPEKDMYFEIQGHYTHGDHPFNPENPEDIKELKELEEKDYYDSVDVWTIRDPKKRQCAKNNNLNWVEVFSIKLDKVIEVFEHEYSRT